MVAALQQQLVTAISKGLFNFLLILINSRYVGIAVTGYSVKVAEFAIGDANIDQRFSVWDPKLVGSSGLGGYVTFSASTSPAWKPVPAGGSYVANVPNTRIESGQGFIVYTTPGNGNINLKESSKISGSNTVFRPISFNTAGIKQSLTTNFYSVTNGTAVLADGNDVVFSSAYSNAIDNNSVSVSPPAMWRILATVLEISTILVVSKARIRPIFGSMNLPATA